MNYYNMYWTNKQKDKVLITEMSDEYLLNCIKLVESNYERYVETVEQMNSIDRKLFSMDEIPYEEDINLIHIKYPIYTNLINEKKRRKL